MDVKKIVQRALKICDDKGVWKSLIAFAPGPLVVWANQWFELFQKLTFFSNPDWQEIGDNSALAISIPVAAIISILWQKTVGRKLKRRATLFLRIFLVLMAACAGMYFFLRPPRPQALVEALEMVWLVGYVFMLVSLVVSIVSAVLYKQS